ncbi:MAG: hypothetical protein ACE5GE_06260 [Phycisphaerae bacterium]
MIALLSVWMGVGCLLLSAAMVIWRPAFNDITVVINLYFGCPGAVCLAGLVLWSHRKDTSGDPGTAAQRLQCKVAIGLALAAAAVVYALVIGAQQVTAPGGG